MWNLSGDEQEGEQHRQAGRDEGPPVAGEQLFSLLGPMWLPPADSIKALPNCALFGLLTGCGLRISEALGLVSGVAVARYYTYMAGGNFQIVNVADPSSPTLAGSYDTDAEDVALAPDSIFNPPDFIVFQNPDIFFVGQNRSDGPWCPCLAPGWFLRRRRGDILDVQDMGYRTVSLSRTSQFQD